MKVLILSTYEQEGGAAIAAKRLMLALRKSGIDAKMLVGYKQSTFTEVVAFYPEWQYKMKFFWERIKIWINLFFKKENLFSIDIANTGIDITNTHLFKEADIIHLHWINHGMLSLKNLQSIVRSEKQVIWTMHDLWPVTGICHYPGNCTKYHTVCEDCPLLPRNPIFDLTKHVFSYKKTLKLPSIYFVGCSNWIIKEAKLSSLIPKAELISIPNPIDTGLFKKKNKEEARKLFNLPVSKKLLLFGAARTSDKRKGINYLIEACVLLKEKYPETIQNVEIILLGNKSDELSVLFPVEVHSLGFINDPERLSFAYSAADLFVVPSTEDNLPNTIMESMACGTPCIGFNIGGIPEMIDHKINGYIAEKENSEDLATGIHWILRYSEEIDLSRKSREKVHSCYSEAIIAKKYTEVYMKSISKD